MAYDINLLVLAAGQGTRMKLPLPKALAPIAGQALMDFPIKEAIKFSNQNGLSSSVSLVIGHKRELVRDHARKAKYPCQEIQFAVQEKQLGTADAVKSFFNQCENSKNIALTLILCADTPLIKASDFEKLYKTFNEKKLAAIAATFQAENPAGYGRIVKGNKGFRIVEHKDASEEILKINEVNSGLYLVKTDYLLKKLENINDQNAQGEFYLTDIFAENENVEPLLFNNPLSFLGVNDIHQLEKAEELLMSESINSLKEIGVRFIKPDTISVISSSIGSGSIVYPTAWIENSTIGENVIIENGAIIKNSQIADDSIIKAYTSIEDSEIKASAQVGPYARIRPGSVIGEEAKIGNFVETKKSELAKGAKVSHLSYVGDAKIGENANLGCGFITCNYDGANKFETKIGANTFIGSDCQMIAPVEVGDNCYVAAGSTVTHSMKDGDFAIARTRQVTKEGLAKKFLKSK